MLDTQRDKRDRAQSRAGCGPGEPDDERIAELRADVVRVVDESEPRNVLRACRKHAGAGEATEKVQDLLDLRAVRIRLDRGDERRVFREVPERVVERPSGLRP